MRTNDARQPDDPLPTYLGELRRAYSWPQVIIPAVLFVFSVWGVQTTFADARGDTWFGWAPFIASSLMSVWWALAWFLPGERSMVSLLMRIVSACLTVQVPLLLAISTSIVVLALLPPNAEAIIQSSSGSASGFHYWWGEYGAWGQGGMTLIGGYGISAFVGLMAVIIILLPLNAIVAPSLVAAGSRIESVRQPTRRNLTTVLLWCGLGMFTLGVCLAQFVERGPAHVAGVVLVWIGGASLALSFASVLFAGRKK